MFVHVSDILDVIVGTVMTTVKVVSLLLLALLLIAVTGWGTLAIYFSGSATGTVQTVAAGVFALLGVATIAGLCLTAWRTRMLIAFGVVVGAVLFWWFGITPSNDRTWQANVAEIPYATIHGDEVTVHHIRDFDYRSETDYLPKYYRKTFNLSQLEGADLFAIYWMGPAIAHVIVSFDFGAQGHLPISIEARKEQGEGYSAIKGFFRQYELIYIVADERDVIRLRTNYRHNPPEEVYLYRVQAPPENVRRLFLAYLRQINALKDRPQFYNTLTANCTNNIWLHARVNPDHIPFSWKILLSGYLPEYLYEAGRLDRGKSFAELQRRGHINARARAAGAAAGFSQRIRRVE